MNNPFLIYFGRHGNRVSRTLSPIVNDVNVHLPTSRARLIGTRAEHHVLPAYHSSPSAAPVIIIEHSQLLLQIDCIYVEERETELK